MRGTVLFVDLKSDSGVAAGDDGKRYGFSLQSCPAGAPPVGARVDFEIRENAAADVYVLHTPFAAKLDWLFWFLFSWRGRVSRDQMIAFFACAVLFLPIFAVCATWSGIPSFSTAGGVLATYVFLSVAVKRRVGVLAGFDGVFKRSDRFDRGARFEPAVHRDGGRLRVAGVYGAGGRVLRLPVFRQRGGRRKRVWGATVFVPDGASEINFYFP